MTSNKAENKKEKVWGSRKLLENWFYKICIDTLRDQNGCWKWSCKWEAFREVFLHAQLFKAVFSLLCHCSGKGSGCQDTQTGLLCLHSKSKMSDELQGNNCTLQPALEDGIAFFPIHWTNVLEELKCDAFVFYQNCREITFFSPLSNHQHIFFIHVTVGVIFL